MKPLLFKWSFCANFAQTVFMHDLIKQIEWFDKVIEKQLQIVRNELLRNITIFMVVKINLSKRAVGTKIKTVFAL